MIIRAAVIRGGGRGEPLDSPRRADKAQAAHGRAGLFSFSATLKGVDRHARRRLTPLGRARGRTAWSISEGWLTTSERHGETGNTPSKIKVYLSLALGVGFQGICRRNPIQINIPLFGLAPVVVGCFRYAKLVFPYALSSRLGRLATKTMPSLPRQPPQRGAPALQGVALVRARTRQSERGRSQRQGRSRASEITLFCIVIVRNNSVYVYKKDTLGSEK